MRFGDPVRSVYRKYDGSLHWHTILLWLGEDEHGVWLGSPGGGRSRRGAEPSIVLGYAYATLVPRDAWWTAIFNSPGRVRTEVYCDVTTVPQWQFEDHPPIFTMIDLDLDVIRRRDGDTEIDDEHEFLEHKEQMGYPPEIVAAAEASSQWLLAAVSAQQAPFDPATYRPWLERIPATWPEGSR